MPDTHALDDPTNRIVAVFDRREALEKAHQELTQYGLMAHQIRILEGQEAAEQVDTSAKWFADTDEEIARYRQELRAGNIVISVPARNPPQRNELHEMLKRCGARRITHFGEWITETMR